jgi:mono/diheme cytochrome c family protein
MPSGAKPLGHVVFALFLTVMSGGGLATSLGYGLDTRGYNLAHGRVVFKQHCMRCHDKGSEGAPVLGDPDDWATRIDQPLSMLIKHAIEGHGDMPPRGQTGLADQEVASAVAYVANRAKTLMGRQVVAEPANYEPIDDVVMKMFLLLIGKERWK